MEIDTSILVIVVSPTTREAHHSPMVFGRWWTSQVVGDTTMTKIEASIPIATYLAMVMYDQIVSFLPFPCLQILPKVFCFSTYISTMSTAV